MIRFWMLLRRLQRLLVWRRMDYADRWLYLQQVKPGQFRDDVHREHAEGHGKRGP